MNYALWLIGGIRLHTYIYRGCGRARRKVAILRGQKLRKWEGSQELTSLLAAACDALRDVKEMTKGLQWDGKRKAIRVGSRPVKYHMRAFPGLINAYLDATRWHLLMPTGLTAESPECGIRSVARANLVGAQHHFGGLKRPARILQIAQSEERVETCVQDLMDNSK